MEPVTRGSSASSGSSFTHTDPTGHDETNSRTPEVVEQAKQTASQMVGQVKEQASVRLSGQIEQAAEGLGTASETIRNVSQQLRDNGQEPVAQYVDRAAHHVERVSTYLRGKDLDALVTDVEHFARRQPQVFLAGALGLGMLAARFLKSTPERTDTRFTGSDPLATPRLTPSWQSPTEYHGLSTPTPSGPGMPPRTPSSDLSSGMSTSTPSRTTPSVSTPSTSTPSPSSPVKPSASTPSTSSSSGLGTSPTIAKPGDVPQSTEPMKPVTNPTTGDQDSNLRRSA